MHDPTRTSECACGRVALTARGEPILCAECGCSDCRTGAARIEALPGAPPIVEPHGTIASVLFRKDRVTVDRGGDHLVDHRLSPDAPTRRVVASCCNTFLYLDFEPGHWLTMHRARLSDPPAPVYRVQTRGLDPATLPQDGLPSFPGFPVRFVVRLLRARIGMWFGG